MKTKSMRERLLASSMICGAAFAALSATAAYAQDEVAVEEIVVTGSRIARPDLVSSSPIATVGEKELQQQGVVNTENLLNTLPQAVPGVTSTVNNGSGGAATVNLRGLGPVRTLVLVDGKRQTPTTQSGVVDINLIPPALIQNVEVVTGGASAVYGSDAIAGVVNFVLKKDFEGFQFTAGYQNTDDLDAPIYTLDATMGANFADGRGNVVLSLGYSDREPLTQGKRGGLLATSWGEPSAAQRAAGVGLIPSGSNSQEDGRVNSFATGTFPTVPGSPATSATSALFLPNGDVRAYAGDPDNYNFAPINYLQTPQTRYSVTTLGSYKITDSIEAFAKGNFVYSNVTTQLAETPIGNRTFRFTLDNNPFLTPAAKQALNSLGSRTAYTIPSSASWAAGTYTDVDTDGDGVFDTVSGVFNRRLSEVGPRIQKYNFYGFQTQLGLRGDLSGINGGWEAYIQYGNTHGSSSLLGDTSLARIQQGLLLNAAGTGCLDPSNGCVPVNLFGRGRISAEAANFIKTRIESSQDYEQLVSAAFVSGNTDNFFTLPAGGIGFAVGAEYRYESFDFRPSQDLAVGNVTGFNASPPVSGDFDTYELYGETLIPLVKDLPFAQSVNLELAGRIADYSTQDKLTKTFKIAGDWAINDDLRLRASFNRAIRTPSVGELFQPLGNGFPTSTDPCSARGAPNAQVRQACINSGLAANLVGTIAANAQTQTLNGGNPNLEPEVAETFTAGFVYQPSFIPRLAITVDYYDISIEKVITSFGGSTQSIMNICYGSTVNGNAASPYCQAIRRLPNGSIDFVQAANVNGGFLKNEGIDVGVSYRFDLADVGLPDVGGVSIKSLYTNSWKNSFQPDALASAKNCIDQFGSTCANTNINPQGVPLPRHKLRTAINWSYENVGLNLVWSFLDDVRDGNDATTYVVEKIGVKNYIDLSADWKVTDNVNLTGGVRNLTQESYPILAGNASPSNSGFPAVYDVLGRMFFINATLKY
ncbi:TonB-dependent receptor [Caulobacter segnis]|uniref:TonB-dependent receptor plug domain-containing protein n=1 Tax=Caulobacter segnis TaxID=88688 RepID=UPI0024100C17|nr:TonB-dependent receptor [Caulobacter segnis]MDG2522095.1 TonB-dependent receptor [Caulobacter segnis]